MWMWIAKAERRGFRRLMSAAGLAGGVLLGSGGAQAAPMLSIDIDGQGPICDDPCRVTIESTVSVIADDIPAGSDLRGLFGFGFRILFDANLFEADLVEVAPTWIGLQGSVDLPGEIGVTANLFDPVTGMSAPSGPSGNGILLATFRFVPLQRGVAHLSLQPFTGPGDNLLFDATVLDDMPAGFFVSGMALVPEPGLPLLLGLLALRLRRRS